MREYSAAIFIGRFQPFHITHERIVREGLEKADEVLIFIGSANSARSIKNPFTIQERTQMIRECFPDKERVKILPIRDYFYSDAIWFTQVQEKIRPYLDMDKPICVLGAYKDEGSYFLKYFEGIQKELLKVDGLNASDIREMMFDENYGLADYADKLPEAIQGYLLREFIGTDTHRLLKDQMTVNRSYHRMFESYPFGKPIFTTVDAVVTHYGHVLVVTRKDTGDYALPGGFLKPTETIENGMLRELKEETKIKVDPAILKSKIVSQRVFDYPGRSLRGRIITHAFHINLDIGRNLPEIKGSDDASHAQWLPIADVFVYENKFYEDHAQIISFFINREM